VNGGDDPPPGISEQDRHAVRDANDDGPRGVGRDDRVGLWRPDRAAAAGHDDDDAAVDLADANDIFGFHAEDLRQPRVVRVDAVLVERQGTRGEGVRGPVRQRRRLQHRAGRRLAPRERTGNCGRRFRPGGHGVRQLRASFRGRRREFLARERSKLLS
jgi:hypothetical protein